MAAQGQADYESQLEEAAVLRLASNPCFPVLRWFSAAVCTATSHKAGARTVRNRQEDRGTEVSCHPGWSARSEILQLLLQSRGVESRIRSTQMQSAQSGARTDA